MRKFARTAIPIFTLLIALIINASQPMQGQTFRVIYAFTAGADGYQPYGGLTLDRGGNLYGTTTDYTGPGTVFRLKSTNGNWVLDTLHTFNGSDGDMPQARVVFGPGGILYGTTPYGGSFGYGTVYSLGPPATACVTVTCPWRETVLYSFTGGLDGLVPWLVDPVFDNQGNLYGTTEAGGIGVAGGVVFKLTLSNREWRESVIFNFPGTSHPYSGVTFDMGGNLYGTTTNGGPFALGNVFQLAPSGSGWTATDIYDFRGGSDGGVPIGGLIVDRSGRVFGTTSQSSSGGGSVFDLSQSGANWTFDLVYGLNGSEGEPLGNLVMDVAGNLYGTTFTGGANQFGTVFKLTPRNGGWTYTSLHDFTDGEDGGLPFGGPTMDANGNLYGTTTTGGLSGGNCPNYGCGVVWEITP
jgi:uncharacterized repeat protein (TIGR03803 family)